MTNTLLTWDVSRPTAVSGSYRPKRRARDAIAEIHFLASGIGNYEWVFEGGHRSVLRYDRPQRPHEPGAEPNRGTNGFYVW